MHSGSRAGTSGVQGQLGLQTNHVSKSEKLKKKKKKVRPGVMVYTFNPSSWEVRALW